MKKRDFDIAFRGLALGQHEFQYDLDDTFFTLFEYSDYRGLRGTTELKMLKSETVLDLEFHFAGSIETPCDITNETAVGRSKKPPNHGPPDDRTKQHALAGTP